MPIIDDVLDGLQIQLDALVYSLLYILAEIHWSLLRAFIMMGHAIELFNQWLIDTAFVPLIAATNASLQPVTSIAFVVALLVLGITYMLAAFVRMEVVNPRSAITWYLAGALFFTLGPALFTGMSELRREVGGAFYASTLSGLTTAAGGAFSTLDSVRTDELGMFTPCDNLGVYLPGATGPSAIDGLDVTLAYLRADGLDVMGYLPPVADLTCPPHLPDPDTGEYTAQRLPWDWRRPGSFFDEIVSGPLFPILTLEERTASLGMATSAQGRMLMAWPLVFFGVTEQLVYLLLTVAQGLTFLSFSAAIMFAFFKRTEVIARSIVDQWIELIIQTVILALIQSLVVAFFLAGTSTGHGMVVLGIGLICQIFMGIVLWSGVKAVWNSVNRLFNAFGQAAGGTVVSVGQAAKQAGQVAAGAVTGGAALGAGALAGMQALNQGATPAQAAGISLGGSPTLSGAARTLAYLPGLRDTALGEAAEQFTEGSITRQVAGNLPLIGGVTGPLVGASLLSDRDPANETLWGRPMLVPAVGEGLSTWTRPLSSSEDRADDVAESSFTPIKPSQVTPPPRMGTFTPIITDVAEHEAYTTEMTGEEMEQHLSGVVQSSTSATSTLGDLLQNGTNDGDSLRRAAEALTQAAQRLSTGQLRVEGPEAVAGVMGDVVNGVQSERGEAAVQGIDPLSLSNRIAQVMGMQSSDDNQPPVQADLARFSLFADRALRMGLSGEQAESVIRTVKSDPEGQLPSGTRHDLIGQVRSERNLSWEGAEQAVDGLVHAAQLLPQAVTAFGQMQIPTDEAKRAER